MAQRLFEAGCPPKGTPVQMPICCRPVDLDAALRQAAKALRTTAPVVADALMVQTDDRVLAFVVAPDGSGVDCGAALQALQGRVPDYALPVIVKVVASIERSSSGKVDSAWLDAHSPVLDMHTVRVKEQHTMLQAAAMCMQLNPAHVDCLPASVGDAVLALPSSHAH